jgi:methionyl-tRNA formyltransferase
MKPQKIILLAGAFYYGVVDILESKQLEYKIILHKKNPEIVNNSFLNSKLRASVELTENNDEVLEILKNFSPDIIISMGWRKILKQPFFNIFKSTLLINIHPAILPDYRGYHTEPYVIMNNETEHGITAHLLTEELDKGDIILQTKFPINEYSTVKSIKHEVENLMPSFFLQLLGLIEQEVLPLVAQTGETKKVAPKRNAEDSQINENVAIGQLYDSIRACDPDSYPAFFLHRNEKIYIKIWTNRNNKKSFEI